jgi:hypothetical protein
VTRGFETAAVTQQVELTAGQEAAVEITLERSVDLRKLAGDAAIVTLTCSTASALCLWILITLR